MDRGILEITTALLAGMAFTPELYAAGISVAGPSNLLTFISSTPEYWVYERSLQYTRIGHPVKDKKLGVLKKRITGH